MNVHEILWWFLVDMITNGQTFYLYSIHVYKL